MINFQFRVAHQVLVEIGLAIRTSSHNMRVDAETIAYEGEEKHDEALRQSIDAVKWITEATETRFADLNSDHIRQANERLKGWITTKNHHMNVWQSLYMRAIALRDNIETELTGIYCYQYPKQLAGKLISWETDWGPTISRFLNVKQDIFCAVDCYALQHNTASVFHCMRILEHGLAALAEDVGLVFDVQQWNTIIEQIEAKTAEMRKTLPKGSDKNERMQFLSEAAKEFYYFKDGWRNYVSHNRAIYDTYQAAGTLEHVRSFMNHLSTRLSE